MAPIDWGIGHASRCIPIINELLNQGAEVLLAGDGRSLSLLQKEFPQLEFYRLKGYNITYQNSGSILFPLIRQVPKIISSIIKEHKELEKIIKEKNIDAVISDNRFGLYTDKIPCIFISHQLSIIMPPLFKWAEKNIIYRWNRKNIERFSQCWIPDDEGENNLSGVLTMKYPLPANTQFIGPLSRFKYKEGLKKEYDILVILSGPEPQRTILENLLIEQLKPLPLKALIVQGKPEETEQKKIKENLSITSFLNAEELNTAILASDIVISRSGYSTIMDLAALGSKAIFIPTPGQTEQEYLAERFKEKKMFYSESQSGFDLQRAMKEAVSYSGMEVRKERDNMLQRKISELLGSIRKG